MASDYENGLPDGSDYFYVQGSLETFWSLQLDRDFKAAYW